MNVNVTFNFTGVLMDGYANVRHNYFSTQPLVEGYPYVRHNYFSTQPLIEGFPTVRSCWLICQVLFPDPPERPVSNENFPGFGNNEANPTIPAAADPFNSALPGLTYSVHKKPLFKTTIKEAANGNEVRNSLTDIPRWDFEFNYEFLSDQPRATGDSSLKTIMGFFLQRRGSYDTFLVKDPDDYLVQGGLLGVGDATTTEFTLSRNLGGFVEPVGQVDQSNTLNVYLDGPVTRTIPSEAPYTITPPGATGYISTTSVRYVSNGVALTRVATPAEVLSQDQYAVVNGVYTFHVNRQGVSVIIDYKYLVPPSMYTVLLPNAIQFVSAPTATTEVTADFQFYFRCRFAEDQQDYEKFYDQLWTLQTCALRSVIS